MKLPDAIMTPDGRRALAFVALVGGAIVMTLFAAAGVYLTRNSAQHAFYLALAAHFQVFVVLFAIGALLVRRTIKASKTGFEISDAGEAAAAAAQVTADAAQRKADQIEDKLT